jgi:hypothetical protein
MAQVHRGGAGYREVHPLQIAFALRLHGLDLPPELERYRPFLQPDLTLTESISAWEKSLTVGCENPSEISNTDLTPRLSRAKTGDTGETVVPGTTARSPNDLTKTAWKLLRTIHQMGAMSAETAKTRTQITSRARTGNNDSKHNQSAFTQLSDLGWIAARKNVGTWLTDAGIAAADKRSIKG